MATSEVSRAPELVSDVLADALRHVSRSVSEHRLTVEIEDEFLLAQMDGRLIVQVVVNLLNNAIAYTPAGSSIRLTAHRERSVSGDRVVVAVADDGSGHPSRRASARVRSVLPRGTGGHRLRGRRRGRCASRNGAGSFALPLYLKGARQ